jgi:hypothetical protein
MGMAVRVAVISTPRAGNTWLRQLLMDMYGIPGLAVHKTDELDWSGLPPECALQLHWHRTPALLEVLHEAHFRVVTLVRHPLDVLISILQFSLLDASTLSWLDGEGGGEEPIYGAMPGSAAFADYATGPRAAALLGVSTEWWPAPECCRVRYEDLVADPVAELRRVMGFVGEPASGSLVAAAQGATLAGLRTRTGADHHFWQGRPGLWKLLLTAPVADMLSRAYPAYFQDIGYTCEPDQQLTPSQADANWIAMRWSQFAPKLQQDAAELVAKRLGFRELERQCQEAAHHYRELAALTTSLQEAHGRLQADHAELKSYFDHLGPSVLGMFRDVRKMLHRFPTVAGAVKRTLRLRRSA